MQFILRLVSTLADALQPPTQLQKKTWRRNKVLERFPVWPHVVFRAHLFSHAQTHSFVPRCPVTVSSRHGHCSVETCWDGTTSVPRAQLVQRHVDVPCPQGFEGCVSQSNWLPMKAWWFFCFVFVLPRLG